MFRFRLRPLLALGAIAAALTLVAADAADARMRGSFGSRGTRTFSAPPATNTAPRQAAPIERSMTQPGQATNPAAAPRSGAQPGGFFSRPGGLLGGLAAGFLGAGLFGMLFGNGFLSGLGSFASLLGLLLQIALVVIVARLAWAWWQRRQAPAAATAGGPAMRDMGFGGLGGGTAAGSGFGGGHAAGGASGRPITIDGADYDAFERLLSEIQTAYGREDFATLRERLTPEMMSYFAEELASNASRGVRNEISNVKLEQGDLAEAWREGDTDFATVAMRYSLDDRTVDRNTGALVEQGPSEATELWTFKRAGAGAWQLSAIQQT